MRPPPQRNFVGKATPQRRPQFLCLSHGPDPAPYNRILGEQPYVRSPMEVAVQRPHHLNALPLVPMNRAREAFQHGRAAKPLFESMCSAASLNGQLAKRPPGKKVVTVYAY